MESTLSIMALAFGLGYWAPVFTLSFRRMSTALATSLGTGLLLALAAGCLAGWPVLTGIIY